MGLHGDLSTLDLPSLFQNLEGAQKTGLLSIQAGEETTALFFEKGKLARISYPARAGLVEYLVESGCVSPEDVERARKAKRRGRSLAEALVETGAIPAERLAEVGAARLCDEACEVLAAGAQHFEFTEVDRPGDGFDPDERALSVALAASPLLLESARRSDHWAMIRERVPSDSTHYLLAKAPRAPSDAARARFVADVAKLLDGTRTVREVVGRFPTRRFEVYQLLADLAEKQSIRAIPAADLNRRILELARKDRPRALALLARALEENPRSLPFLCTKALLAEKAGELEEASEALKLVLHLQLEGEDRDAAEATLERLRELDRDDPFAWEKGFELALEEGRAQQAIEQGRTLVALHAKRGLPRKACTVLERLIRLCGPKFELVRDLARARSEAGERELAVKGLESFAASLVAQESYPLAAKAYEEVLAIAPSRAKAKQALEELRSGATARRKARWRTVRRRALLAFLALVVVPWFGAEAWARRSFAEATSALARDGGPGSRDLARERCAELVSSWGWTATGRYDAARLLAELEGR